MALRACVALLCLGAMVAPATADDTRPSVIVVERAAAKMEKISMNTAAKIQETVDKTFEKVRSMAGGEVNDQLLFRMFQLRNRRLQILNFFSQQRLANIRESTMKRLENLESNPEATQMLEDTFSQAQSRVQTALGTQSSRLQNIFNVANETPPTEPNGLRPLESNDDPDSGIEDSGDDDL